MRRGLETCPRCRGTTKVAVHFESDPAERERERLAIKLDREMRRLWWFDQIVKGVALGVVIYIAVRLGAKWLA